MQIPKVSDDPQAPASIEVKPEAQFNNEGEATSASPSRYSRGKAALLAHRDTCAVAVAVRVVVVGSGCLQLDLNHESMVQ